MIHSLFPENAKKNGLLIGLPSLFFILVSAYFLTASTHSVTDFPLDDAWIHRVYARSLASGQGLAYNSGGQETGATSPLWILVTAPVHWFEARWSNAPVVGVKLLGGLLGLMTITLVALIIRKATEGNLIPLLVTSIWAVEPRLIFSSYSGMEVNLFVVLFLGLILADLSEKKQWTYLLLSLLPVCRPEGLIILPIYGLRDILRWTARRKSMDFLGWLWVPVPILVWMGICKAISGLYLPLPFYQKAHWFAPSFSLVHKMGQLQAHHGPFNGLTFGLGIVAFGFFCFRNGSSAGRKLFFSLLGVPLVLLIGILSSRGISLDGYYWLRYVDPADFILMIAATLGLAVTAGQLGQWRQWIRQARKEDWRSLTFLKQNLPLLAGILLVLSLPHWWQSIEEKRFHLWSDGRIINLMNVEVGRWLNSNTPVQATVGVNDAGAIRYFSHRKIIDFMGLNNREVALRRISIGALLTRVDWIALYPAWFQKYDLKVFDLRQVFAVNPETYSLCNCPTQTYLAIAERRR